MLKQDIYSIWFLILLYLLQGVIIGITISIPLILQSKGATWSQQAIFSFAYWPFSLKLLWAPIIDYGRRKSWLLPIQLLIGTTLIILSFYISQLLIDRQHILLTVIFLYLYFLTASQDICVDGWSLKMLTKENVGWSSTCQIVGQTIGLFIGNVVFLTLESEDLSNNYIRKLFSIEMKDYGFVSYSTFIFIWGIIFIVITLSIVLFKDEIINQEEKRLTIFETYVVTIKLLDKSWFRQLAFISLTYLWGFGATYSMTNIKLIQNGLEKETFALLTAPLIIIKILVPFSVSHLTSGTQPLNVLINSYIPRMVTSILVAIIVYITPLFHNSSSKFYYYLAVIFVLGLNEIFVSSMRVSKLAFYARISDSTIGGTYLTFLHTISNLGLHLTETLILFSASYLTLKPCPSCQTIDAYYIEVTFCLFIGILWLIWKYRTLLDLQNLPLSKWYIETKDNIQDRSFN